MKTIRLLSFLCLLVLGWSSAWADAVTWAYSDDGSATNQSTTWGTDLKIAKNGSQDFVYSPITLTIMPGSARAAETKTNNVNGVATYFLRIGNGAVINVTPAEGYKITAIAFKTYNRGGTFSGFTTSNGTATWSGSSTTSVSTTYTPGTSYTYEDIKTITVTYEALPSQADLIPTTMSWKGGGAGLSNGIAVGNTAVGTFYLRNANTLAILSTSGITASNFNVTSTNGTAGIRFIANDGIRLNVTPAYAGDVTVTVQFLGNDTYAASEWTFTLRTAGTAITLSDKQTSLDATYIDATNWYVRIANSANATNLDPNRFEVTFDTAKVAKLGNVGNYYNNANNIRLIPCDVGSTTMTVKYLGDATYFPSDPIDIELTVKKHAARVTFSNDSYTTRYVSDGTVVSGIPTLSKWMDDNSTTPTYSVVYSSSDTQVATVDPSTGVVTMHNSGTTVIMAEVVVTKNIVINGETITVEAYTESYDTYALTIQGNVNHTGNIIWLSQLNPSTGSPQGGKYRGSYWTQKNVQYWHDDNGYYLNPLKEEDLGNQFTTMPYGNEIIVSASYFSNLNWLSNYPHIWKLKNDTYYSGEENAKGSGGFGWRYSDVSDYIPDEANATKNASKVWMNNIEYSISDPHLLDSYSKGEYVQDGCKAYSIRPYPVLDANGEISTTDSVTIYATIPGGGNTNPLVISHKVMITKGSYNLGVTPREGYVTVGEWVIPYVNIPDIKLKDIKRVTAWVEDGGTVAEVAFETKVTEDGKTIYVLYEKDVTSDTWIHTKYDTESALDFIDAIYPKVIGKQVGQTVVHIKVESPYYEDAETTYTVNVLPDSDKPAFHWACNDDKSGTHTWNIGWDKGTNQARGPITYGEDDGMMKKITMVQGDYIYMPGIVGTANGNEEYSTAFTYHYLYGIKNGKVEMNREPYFWREGVPNYFFTNSQYDSSIPLIPENGASTQQIALIYKHRNQAGVRLDTLTIYANYPGTTYLWAQDPQTHLCCTPIEITVLPKSKIDRAKKEYLSTMTYPYTWDFEHMNLGALVNEDYLTQRNLVSGYWEDHRSKPTEYYQANGLMNFDHDDKNNDGIYRERWFKDITAGGEYVPFFYGLMINLAGLDFWDQKFNRFNIHKDPNKAAFGDYIYFEGGPTYLQLPGFGINAENIDSNDGTRKNDNKILKGNLHNAINTIDWSVADGTYSKVYSGPETTQNVNTAYNSLSTNTQGVNNRKVRFVIKAQGGRKTVDKRNLNGAPGKNGSSQFHIGGKNMIDAALKKNEIEWTNATHPGFSQYNVNYNEPETYVFELDPYDPEYQDHIYIMFNNDVKVYWMAISTEPRDMRSDYDMFTYSYPKDIDMDKTNILMNISTTNGVTKKSELDGSTTQTGQDKIAEGGEDNNIQFKAYYASQYERETETMTISPFLNNRIPANEGALIYPSVGPSANWTKDGNVSISEKFGHKGTAGMEQKSQKNRLVTSFLKWEYVYNDKGEVIAQIPLYKTKRVNYSYQYVPTYFIANAENVYNYSAGSVNNWYEDDKYEYGYQFGKVIPLSAGEAPYSLDKTENNVTIRANQSTNMLRGSVYTTYIEKDYKYTNPKDEEPEEVRWINLGLTNEYIARTLVVEDHKTLDGILSVENGYEKPDYDTYYELIGPDFVRFYRANKDQNMKNRRAYLSLTWEEYNVNTDGKRGVTYPEVAGDKTDMWFGWGGTDKSLWTEDNTNTTNIGASSAGNPVGPVFQQHYYSVRIVKESDKEKDEDVVSEDGGFPDGIDEVKANDGKTEIYNLNGMRVNSLRKGIYIVNGKKVIVK